MTSKKDDGLLDDDLILDDINDMDDDDMGFDDPDLVLDGLDLDVNLEEEEELPEDLDEEDLNDPHLNDELDMIIGNNNNAGLGNLSKKPSLSIDDDDDDMYPKNTVSDKQKAGKEPMQPSASQTTKKPLVPPKSIPLSESVTKNPNAKEKEKPQLSPTQSTNSTPKPPQPPKPDWKAIAAQLSHQSDCCYKAAAFALHQKDKQKALQYSRLRKAFQEDAEKIVSPQTSSESIVVKKIPPLPGLKMLFFQDDVPQSVIFLTIKKISSIKELPFFDKSHSVYCSGTWENPLEANKSFDVKDGKKLESNSQDIVGYNETKPIVFTFEQSLTFKRCIMRNPVKMDFFQNQGLVFKKKIILGSIAVPLADMITKSIVEKTVPITLEGKSIGTPTVTVQLKIRQPYEGVHVESLPATDEWIIIKGLSSFDEVSSYISAAATPANATTAKPVNATAAKPNPFASTSASKDSAKKPALSTTPNQQPHQRPQPQPAAKPNMPPLPPQPPQIVPQAPSVNAQSGSQSDQEMKEFYDISIIASSTVLEKEIEFLNSLKDSIISGKPITTPTCSLGAIDAIINSLQTALESLSERVGSGELSFEDYLEQLRRSIPQEKQRALEFKKKGQIEYAKKALLRTKWIDAELLEAQSMSMPEEGEEE